MKHIKIITILLLSSLLCSCHSKGIYNTYLSLPNKGWHQDSALTFTFDIEDTTQAYNILLHVRHTERYPYQNMWLIIDRLSRDTIAHQTSFYPTDTIEFYLADNRGVWLGNGRNGIMDMPVLYENTIRFPHKGCYEITLRHGMRTDYLQGVHDVGVQVLPY